tara:strand:+ start:196 stop:399 length:204 start_codon:yes stop_codon:yes gene_type:complete
MIPVEGHKNHFRDESTGAIINCDNREYRNYLDAKKRNNIKRSEFDSMKNEIKELKSLLNELASKIAS